MTNRRRPHFTGLWLSDTGRDGLDDLAKQERLSRSATLRLLLAYAIRTMPKGWRP